MVFIWDRNTGKIGPARIKASLSPSYTVAEIKQLAREFADTDDDFKVTRQIILSAFTLWLARREQGKGTPNA